MKTALVFTLLFVCGNLRAQYSIEPFEDYKKCLTGFKYPGYQDTLFPAKFDNVHSIYYSRNYSYESWILSDNGKYGCIDSRGKWVLETKYEALYYNSWVEQLFFKEGGKWGTYTFSGDINLPAIYDTILVKSLDDEKKLERINNAEYVFQPGQNGLFGLYSLGGKELIPIRYTEIEEQEFRLKDMFVYKRLFVCKTNDSIHIYDKKGKILGRMEFKDIQPFYAEQDGNTPILFSVINAEEQYTIVDENGRQYLPISEKSYHAMYSYRNFVERSTPRFAKQNLKGKKGVRMASLSQGTYSASYDQMEFIGDWIYAVKKSKWVVLDTTFNEVYHQLEQDDELLYFYGSETDLAEEFPRSTENKVLEKYFLTNRQYEPLGSTANMFVLQRIVPLKVEKVTEYKKRYALVELRSGKQSPVIYERIIKVGGNGVSYYWCIQPNEEESAGIKDFATDIYDNNGVLKQSIRLNEKAIRMVYEASAPKYSEKYPKIISLGQKKTASDSTSYLLYWTDGGIITDYKFDLPVTTAWIGKDSSGYIAFKQGDWFCVKNVQGIPNNYENQVYTKIETLEFENGKSVVDLVGKEYSVIVNSSTFEPLIDSCTRLFWDRSDIEFGKRRSYHVFVSRKGYLFGSDGATFRLIDSSCFNNPNGLNWIRSFVCIDNKGKIYNKEFTDSVLLCKPVKYGELTVTFYKNVLTIKKYGSTAEKRIPGIKSISKPSNENHLVVETITRKTGWINIETGEWEVEPKYDQVSKPFEKRNDVYLASNRGEKCMVITPDGKPLTEPLFDWDFKFRTGEKYAVARSNGKYGTVNEKFEWVTDPVYKDTKPFGEFAVFMEEEKIYFIDETGKTYSRAFDSINSIGLSAFLFYCKDSIEIIDKKGTVLLPRTLQKTAVEKVDLASMLYNWKMRSDKPVINNGHMFFDEKNTALTRRNNENCLLNLGRTSVTPEEFLANSEAEKLNYGYRQICKREPVNFSMHRYVELSLGKCFADWENSCLSSYDQYGYYSSFYVGKDSLIELKTLSDLFLPNANYESRLDALMEKTIQADQTFGLACVDMKGSIAALKEHFYISKGHICFYECYYSNHPLKVPVSELKDLLRWQDLFE
jgi:hypothetical protein